MSSKLPQARTEGIHIEELDGGVVLYDAASHRAHWLDPETTRVWQAADGARTVAAIGGQTGLPETSVAAVLEQLGARGLLEATGISRRTVLRHAALAGGAAVAAVPLIETVMIPTAVAHASTGGPVGGSGGGAGNALVLNATINYNPAVSPGQVGVTVTIVVGQHPGPHQMPANNTGAHYVTNAAKNSTLLVDVSAPDSHGNLTLYMSNYAGPDTYEVVVTGGPSAGTYALTPGPPSQSVNITFTPSTTIQVYTAS